MLGSMSDQPAIDRTAPASRVAAAMARMQTIDLDRVARKLCRDEGWTEAQAATAVLRYRRFLCMHYLDRDLFVVPARDIDKVWHQHILCTHEYARDCDRVFGRFLHHRPSSGDSEEQESLRTDFEMTEIRYAELFGEAYVETWLTYFLL
ncbi:Protein of unknown function [Rhodospirillales bacterium URHD0017]|nr:Protein of unknown function [Rhodospirillales bacterium URHD0017]